MLSLVEGFFLALMQYSSIVKGTTTWSLAASETEAPTCFLMMFSYSLSFPLLSFHLLYITLASTLAGLKVLGSLRRLTTESKIVLTFCVGFHLSQGSSPDWGSSTGGWRIDMQRSPFSYTLGCHTFDRNLTEGGL